MTPALRHPDLLTIYLNDHLTVVTAGAELAQRAATAQLGTPHGQALTEIRTQSAADRDALRDLMRAIDVPVRTYKVVLGRVAERAGRLKLNGRLLTRSPLSLLVELEGIALSIGMRRTLWQTLRLVAERDERLDWRRLDDLITGADRQAEAVESVRVATAAQLFGAAE